MEKTFGDKKDKKLKDQNNKLKSWKRFHLAHTAKKKKKKNHTGNFCSFKLEPRCKVWNQLGTWREPVKINKNQQGQTTQVVQHH